MFVDIVTSFTDNASMTASVAPRWCSNVKLCNNWLPVAEMTAYLHPCWNPGSMPRMHFPRTGGVNSRCFRLDENTATDAFSAFFVSSDLQSAHTHTHRFNGNFHANLGKPAVPSVALMGSWGCHKVLQPVPHPLISITTANAFWCKVFTGRMPCLSNTRSLESLK